MTTFLTREEFLGMSDAVIEEVAVTAWGGKKVRVRGLTAAQRDSYESEILLQKGKNLELVRKNLRAKLIVRSVVDEAGNRMFTDADLSVIGSKSAAAIDQIYEVASRLSGISDADEEELAKNSVSDQSDDSSSA